MSDVRETTNKLLELCEEDMLDYKQVLLSALCFMSEADVAKMAKMNGLLDWEDEDPDEDEEVWDDLPTPSLSSLGFSRNWK